MPRAKASKVKAKPKRAAQPAAEMPATADEQALVDRYYAMAEELNGRGSMELAVPFYRQTIALLLAEREQLRALVGSPNPGVLSPSADVDGVLAAAASVDNALPEAELLRQLTALEEELSEQNHQEVAAAMQGLRDQWGQAHPQLLALEAKLHLLEGDFEAARTCFEQALALDGTCVRLRLNTGAARLADGDVRAALEVLRPLMQELDELEACGASGSFWNNLTRAELAAEHSERAAAALQQWLRHAPHTLNLEAWLEQAESLQQAGCTDVALALLQALAEGGTPEQRRAVLPALADLLEAAGAFREAALIYRELLRPGLAV